MVDKCMLRALLTCEPAAILKVVPESRTQTTKSIAPHKKKLRKQAEESARIGSKDHQIKSAMEAKPHYQRNPALLFEFSSVCFNQYGQTGNPEALDWATVSAKATVEATPEGLPCRKELRAYLGHILSLRYEQTGNQQDLKAAIVNAEAALKATPQGHPDKAEWLSNLGDLMSSRYKQTGNLHDLEAAIVHVEASVKATLEDYSDKALWLNNLRSFMSSRYEQTGDLQDLNGAILHAKTSVKATPGDSEKAELLGTLGRLMSSRYERTGNLDDLQAAIVHAEAAVKRTAEDDPNNAGWLSNLGIFMSSRYERTGNLQDLEAAIVHTEAAMKKIAEDHPIKTLWLSNLGSFMGRRYKRTGNLQDLESAIVHATTAVNAIPEDHPDKAGLLNNLGNCFCCRYERTGNLQDLEAAIVHAEVAVKATPEDHPEKAGRLSNLGNLMSRRYGQTGNLEDLEAAIIHAEAAMRLIPQNQPGKAKHLGILGIHMSSRYEGSGNLQDLEAAIVQIDAAVKATPEDHPDKAEHLNNLGSCMSSRYQRTGNLLDLEAAIMHIEAAVKSTSDDHPNKAKWLGNLGDCMSSRYERSGNLQDLKAAIVQIEAAVKATAGDDHPDKAELLYNLGHCMSSRYQRTGNLQDLEAAIVHVEGAVKSTPDDHPFKAELLSILGAFIADRFERTGNLQDLEIAIIHAETAVKATPQDHPGKAGRLHNLANHVGSRFKYTGNLQDLEAAIIHIAAAVQAIPEDHPQRAQHLYFYGIFLRIRASGQRLKDSALSSQAMEKSLSAFIASWNTRAAPALIRLQAALEAAKMLVFFPVVKDLPRAYLLLHDAINLLFLATSRSLDREDHQYILKKLPEFTSLAVSVALEVTQSPLKAIQLLELGHSMTNSQLLDYRTDISNFMQKHPLLAEQFDSLRAEVDSPFPSTNQFSALSKGQLSNNDHFKYKHIQMQQASIRRRNKVAQDFDDILQQIRLQPGFQNFLRVESEEYLSLSAAEGPIVVLNVTELRSDAILVTNEQTTSIPLPQLSHNMVGKYFGQRNYEKMQVFCTLIDRCKKAKNTAEDTIDNEEEDTTLGEISKLILNTAGRYVNILLAEDDLEYNGKTRPLTDLLRELSQPSNSCTTTVEEWWKETNLFPNIGNVADDNGRKRELLDWLWKAAVQPILQELGCYPKVVDPLPRIWWIGIGLMAQAPIHAAAKYKNGLPKMTTLQYCIPSYTSTIRALQYSRTRENQLDRSMKDALIVTMPTTPGASPLDADKEGGNVQNCIGKYGTAQILRRPTAKEILEILPGSSIAHFACHGVSSINPADSHLLLVKQTTAHNGHPEEVVDRLRVKDIAALKLPMARLAYLSACSTAQSLAEDLVDEATHIVSSFHIAGFCHVIGTLWQSEDEACNKIAVEFYSKLSETDNVAESYRYAIMKLMKEKPSQPMYWAPFIHFGA